MLLFLLSPASLSPAALSPAALQQGASLPPRHSHSAFDGLLPEWLPGGMLVEILLGTVLVISICSVLPMLFTWAERRLSGRIQQRQGPNRVGPFGLIQALADGVKLLFKEDIIPASASRFLFALAPGIVLAGTFGAFAMLPFSNQAILVDTPLSIFVIASLLSIEVIGVILAGWASNNKWSILGAMREAAQMVSYEIPMGLCFLLAVASYGTLNLREMSLMQAGGALNVGNWLVFHNPFFAAPAFVIFYIALLANTKRAPFDLPEAESELVSGFHTEYSGIRFSFFFLAEYAAMFLVSGIAVFLFLGGWNIPFVPGELLVGSIGGEALAALSVLLKSTLLVLIMIWIRWTLPRIRIDQVMNLCYKYLTPIALVCLIGTVFWEQYVARLGS
ncbi:MAG: NADH-quinone oxidoreductase subunit NuoH [Planctomycetota bacterium]|nr:MAG: NADH-quinone oxidoreductase subunit NuoH [Planctomycetota bacterium]